MITKIEGHCQFPAGCIAPATHIAAPERDIATPEGDSPTPGVYCEPHADEIAKSVGAPEYVVDCPNCGCRFGTGG